MIIRISVLLFLLVLFKTIEAAHRISNFGAIPHSDAVSSQFINAKALQAAITAANLSETDKLVIIDNKTYYSMPTTLESVKNIQIWILGRWAASKTISAWPKTIKQQKQAKSYRYEDFITLSNCNNITISGGGRIDGRGHSWWVHSWRVDKKYMPKGSSRPHLIVLLNSNNLVMHNLILKNSPSFHVRTTDCQNLTFYNINIKVNTTAQLHIYKSIIQESIPISFPIFPLNTDGIDPSARNVTIFNITCQNFDDVIVPKPSHKGQRVQCTENINVQNITVRLGVGMSIGSVPPNPNHNCIRNVTFKNVQMKRPFKGIYLKTNPGQQGTGIIENIHFQNISMDRPIWWAIYLGPQQQKQPDGGGPGCMLYPFDKKGTCKTQPRVTIRNISLKNINVQKSLLFPIILRCNSANPCSNISFENVRAEEWKIKVGTFSKIGYVCENTQLSIKQSFPEIKCSQKTQNLVTNEEQQVWSKEKLINIVKQLEKAVQQVKYEDIDDEMDQTNISMQQQQIIVTAQ